MQRIMREVNLDVHLVVWDGICSCGVVRSFANQFCEILCSNIIILIVYSTNTKCLLVFFSEMAVIHKKKLKNLKPGLSVCLALDSVGLPKMFSNKHARNS